jgi:hypothetical protein
VIYIENVKFTRNNLKTVKLYGYTIDNDLQEAIQNEKNQLHIILKIIIYIILFCVKYNLSFRGSLSF